METENRNRQSSSGLITKKGHTTLDGIGNFIKFRNRAAKLAGLGNSLSTCTVGGDGVEEAFALQLEVERRRAMGIAYSNIIPPK